MQRSVSLSPALANLIHPSGVPHTDTLGIPWWVQWVLIALLAGIVSWLVIDLRAHRETPSVPVDALDRVEEPRDRLVAIERIAPASPQTTVVNANRFGRDFEFRKIVARALVFVCGLLLGWYALDQARGVESFAGFIGSSGTINAARIAFVFAALFWVGAALVLVAPLAAAIAFLLTGVAGIILATAPQWEARLQWWGAGAAAATWDNLPRWSFAAFALSAICALIAWRDSDRFPESAG